ncbi:hypothetical protein [Paenibacillus wynnii]|uniref:Uncharacterized protein n=1 Tax=Paenibacillus wynnii TaxID=268407 RepID=A0A098MFR3_9BACL|nr:hypothetical protein [Paenibacillus wynnii]KGE20888.1 hypothetical protein PWYN_01535 [Paenibacillus wynnii]
MKKIEWLIAILFMGMGVMCMALSAVSFRSESLLQFGGYVKTFLFCAVLITLILYLVLKWIGLSWMKKQ